MCVVFKQKTAYEMRISDWSSDVCSSDLIDFDIAGRWRRGGASLTGLHMYLVALLTLRIVLDIMLGVCPTANRIDGFGQGWLLAQGLLQIQALGLGFGAVKKQQKKPCNNAYTLPVHMCEKLVIS